MKGNIPSGKGMFVWIMDRLGSPTKLADQLESMELDHVMVKLQNGTLVSDGRKSSEFEASNPDRYIAEIIKRGIDVHGWGYVYASSDKNMELEAATTATAYSRFPVKSWIINAEYEYKSVPLIRASNYVSLLKHMTGLPIGYSTYRFPTYHPEFPWAAFSKQCDYAVPQVYWVKDSRPTGPASQLEKCLSEYWLMNSAMPIIPAGCGYPESGWKPTVLQMKNFFDAVKKNKLPGCTWWEMKYICNELPWVSEITSHKFNDNPTVPDVPTPSFSVKEELNGVISKLNNIISNL